MRSTWQRPIRLIPPSVAGRGISTGSSNTASTGSSSCLQPTGINTCSTCWDGIAPWSALDGEPAPRWGRKLNNSVDYYVTPWAKSGSPNDFGDSTSNVDYRRFYLPLWQNIDAIVREMQRKGMIAHVVMYNDQSFYPVESSADERRYWDYVIRRLGGYWNVVYNDGVDLFEYRSAGWVEEWQQYFENKDPFDHARSSRHGDDDSSLATYRSVQAANQTAPTSVGAWRNILAKTPAKPVTEDDGIRAEKGSGIPPERFPAARLVVGPRRSWSFRGELGRVL